MKVLAHGNNFENDHGRCARPDFEEAGIGLDVIRAVDNSLFSLASKPSEKLSLKRNSPRNLIRFHPCLESVNDCIGAFHFFLDLRVFVESI